MNILFLLVLVGMGVAATASPKSCPASLPTTAAQMKLVPPDCFAGMSYTKLRNVRLSYWRSKATLQEKRKKEKKREKKREK